MRRKTKITLACLCVALGALSFALVGCDGNGNELSTGDEPKLEIPQEPSIEELSDDELYGEWTVTQYPTCEETGVKVRYLLAAPYTAQIATVAALGHEWGEWEEETAPTCLTDGVKMRPCSHCNNKDYASIPALGHEWSEWEVKREATCLSAGYETRVCEHDGSHTETRAVEALGHDWSDWVFLSAPTCTQPGSEQRVCRNDNKHSQMRVLAALGHDWNEPVVTKAPSCRYDGTLTKICRHDSLHTETEKIPAYGHDWGEWILTTAPTETENGTESRWCANGCLTRENRSVPFLGSAGLVYTLNEAGTGYIVSKSSSFYSGKELYIPAKYEGLPVTEIADSAFWASTSLTKVVFGGQIQKIGYHAFASCTRLENLGLPSSVTEIGGLAFEKSGMKSFCIPAGVKKVGAGAFDGWTAEQSVFVAGFASEEEADAAWGAAWRSGCNAAISYETGEESDLERNLTFDLYNNSSAYKVHARNKNMEGAIVIPAYYKGLPVKEIGDNAFMNCKGITRITVEGNNLERVGSNAFVYCVALQTVELPDSVTLIARNAFYRCTGLETFRVPAGVTTIESRTFHQCTSLSSVTLPSTLELIEGAAFSYCTSLLSITIPEGMTSIGHNAFHQCTSLLSVTLPEGMTSIGFNAFDGCTSLLSITLPEGMTSIGFNAFDGCTSLLSITLPEGMTGIESRTFHQCTSLSSVTLPSTLELIEGAAFSYCTALASISLPSSLKSIEVSAFMNCTAMTSIVIPESVAELGSRVFDGWTEEQFIFVAGFASEEEADAAWGANWRLNCNAVISYETGESAENLLFTTLGDGSAYDVGVRPSRRSSLTAVTIPAYYKGLPVKGIAANGFTSCAYLTSVTFEGNNLEAIGHNAFTNCKLLEEIVIPEGVTTIGRNAFGMCKNLKRVTLPSTLTDLGESIFRSCLLLERITVREGNTVYKSENNCLIEIATNTLLAGAMDSVIPEGIVKIGAFAFDSRAIERIRIPASVTEIGERAFWNCAQLREVVFADGAVLSIGEHAFDCSAIESILIPASVTEIGKCAFYGCVQLREVEFEGGAALSIGEYAFAGCTGIDLLELPAGVTVGRYAFGGWTEEQVMIVKGFASLEEADEAWGEDWRKLCNATVYFGEQEFLAEGVKSIGAGAFRGCVSFSQIVIPTTVESVGRAAFYGWTAEQTIIVKGYASEEEADAAWGSAWREGCNATIVYQN